MASILLTENAEGGVKNEQEIIDAAATVFLGEEFFLVPTSINLIHACILQPEAIRYAFVFRMYLPASSHVGNICRVSPQL